MIKKLRTRFRVTNNKTHRSVVVFATNSANAMTRARQHMKWPNYGSDAEGYYNYSIESCT